MQKSETNQAARAHRRVGASTTLNRKYVRRPQRGTEALEASVEEAAQVEALEEARTEQQVMRRAKKIAVEAGEIQRSPQISRFGEDNLFATLTSAPDAVSTPSLVSAPTLASAPTSVSIPTKRKIKIEDETDIEAKEAAEKAQLLQKQQEEAKLAQEQEALLPAVTHPLQAAATMRMRQQNESPKKTKMSAKEMKEREIKKALAKSSKSIDKDIARRERTEKRTKLHFSIARVMLAISCTAAAVMAIMYFVGTNMPDISMRVAAMQTGIRASYPGFVPRGFTMMDLSSEAGKVTLNFHSDENDDAFSLIEENSSWDSSALETNYVKKEFGDKYSIVREQGLTIYMIEGKGAAWVNGGVVYKLLFQSGTLTKKQIQSIAVSL